MKREEKTVMTEQINEKAARELRELYHSFGYTQYRMSKFEEYELYMENKDFIGARGIISFTDTDGRLLALKPDVTLSIIKSVRQANGVQKVFYHENVYRVSHGSGTFRESPQCGLECIGDVGPYEIGEVLYLAVRSLALFDRPFRLVLSHLELVSALIGAAGFENEMRADCLRLIKAKNADGLRELADAAGIPRKKAEPLIGAIRLYGTPDEVLPRLTALTADCPAAQTPLGELSSLCRLLTEKGFAEETAIDLSVVNDMDYYSGVVFRGYLDGLPEGVLSGGCYDRMMQKMGRVCGAVGFAVSLDRLDGLPAPETGRDCDILLLYEQEDSPETVLDCVCRLTAAGYTVRAASRVPDGLRYGKRLTVKEAEEGSVC